MKDTGCKTQDAWVLSLWCFIILMLIPSLVAASGKWEIVRDSEPEVKVDLSYVKFFAQSGGVAYGHSRVLITTKDGGRTWFKRKLPVPGTGIFISRDVGVFMDSKAVYHTEDGGRSWELSIVELDGYVVTAGEFGYRAMHFLSLEEGWTTARKIEGDSAGPSCIFHTNDGGKTWEKQFDGSILSDRHLRINDIFFLDSKRGWAVGRTIKDGVIWNLVTGTSDGGKSWFHSIFEQRALSLSGLCEVFFSNSRTGWAIGTYGDGIYHTEDGGLTWELQFEEPGTAICFPNEKKGWILRQTSLLYTVDGGRTWSEKQLDVPSDCRLADVCFINEDEGWVVGSRGLVMHTRDGGETWERQTTIAYPDLWSVDFTSPRKGIAVGREVLITEDGLNWQTEAWMAKMTPKPGRLSSVDFIDERTGWVTDCYRFWKTEDGGETWKEVELQDRLSYIANTICFVDRNRGWMVHETNGYIYFTNDGGETWSTSCPGGMGTENFTGVNFIDEKNGWATKLSGDVYRTKDGGSKWRLAGTLPGPAPIGGVCFANEDMGWAIVDGDKICHTEDGGERWELDAEFPDAHLTDICYDGGEHLYAVGLWGIILRYTDPDLKGEGYAVEPAGRAITQWGMQKTGESGLPERTEVYQNYPNPFNPETWIPYQLASDSFVSIRVYNSKGQLVRTLDLGSQSAGMYITRDKAAYWDGMDSFGQMMASGVYFFTIQAGEFEDTRKMVITQ